MKALLITILFVVIVGIGVTIGLANLEPITLSLLYYSIEMPLAFAMALMILVGFIFGLLITFFSSLEARAEIRNLKSTIKHMKTAAFEDVPPSS